MSRSDPTAQAPAGHPRVAYGRIGALLINLGTPQRPDAASLRRYLREFLSDRRVVEANPLLWQLVLNLIILPLRPRRSAHAYQAIWDRDNDESPLRRHTRELSQALSDHLAAADRRLIIDWAMRYGTPSVNERLQALSQQGCDRIVLAALYPQYSAATTATAYDAAFRTLERMRWQPAVRTLPPWHDDPVYVRAVGDSIRQHWTALDWIPEVTVLSFHGLPRENLDKGDPYHCQCVKSARLIRDYLGQDDARMPLAFQSRFGPKQWLQPYTDRTLIDLAKAGVKRVAVATPGFVADCVETLEEIALRGRDSFLQHGGHNYTAVPCLNASPAGIEVIAAQLKRELGGWSNLQVNAIAP